MICVGANAPLATCCAMRRVIVVVLPEPAPARMQTGAAHGLRRAALFRVQAVERVHRATVPARPAGLCDRSAKLSNLVKRRTRFGAQFSNLVRLTPNQVRVAD